MKQVEIDRIRNIAIIAHGGAGKTSIAEAILFNAGAVNRLGKVEEGNTVMDFLPEETSRHISTSSSTASVDWNGYRINLVDTPGYQDFIADSLFALRVCEGVLMVISAVSGVQVQTEKFWKIASERAIPGIAFINKMDRERADFKRSVSDIQGKLGVNPVPLQIPIGSEASFRGLIDLVTMRAYTYNMDGTGSFVEEDIPDEIRSEAEEYRDKLVEHAAEGSEELVEKYLESGELSETDILTGLRAGVLAGDILPVFCGSATMNVGVRKLLDSLTSLMPSPQDMGSTGGIDKGGSAAERKPSTDDPFAAFVYKTLADPYAGKLTLFKVISGRLSADSGFYNASKETKERFGSLFLLQGKKQVPVPEVGAGQVAAVAKLKETSTGDTLCDEGSQIVFPSVDIPEPALSYAIAPKSKGDEEKVSQALARLREEDPSIKVLRDDQTKQNILSGLGQQHIEVTVERLKEKFGVEVEMRVPKVPYRETIKGKKQLQSRYKKQTGGRGQYGDVWLEIEPLPRGSDFEFVDRIVGGVVPKQYIPAVEKGVREAMAEGVLAGYPVSDVKVTLYDGSYHSVDSSEMAFKIAASIGFKKGFLDCKPVLLEPIVDLEVTVPDDFMGAVIGDLNSRRGKVVGMEPQGGEQVVKAQVPMAEILAYAPDLRSMTEGRAYFSTSFSHYEEVPAHLAEKIIDEAKKEKG
ncbi:MAG: elongation factor G [bacterium]|nr:MAG: elongation factor G [bacterium]